MIKNYKKGFTLLELLVVVIIIGILAAIALPQYQMAVGKAKFAELKTNAKVFQQAAQRYYMINGKYSDTKLDVEMPSTTTCVVWSSEDQLRCCKKIFNKTMCFYMYRDSGNPRNCFALSVDKKHPSNRLCQKETGTNGSCNSNEGYCMYMYNAN